MLEGMMLPNLWYAISIVVLFAALRTHGCPQRCECLGNIIDCSAKKLREVPTIPRWVQKLNIGENTNLKITEESFSNLHKLQTLSLNGMRMKSTPKLGHQSTLKKLSLANNKIKDVRLDWLQKFDALQELNLAKNSLHTIDPSQWVHPRLRKLDLSANRIENVYANTSFRLPSLTTLRISRNYISADAFRNISKLCASLPSLKTLDLNRNSIENFVGHSQLKDLMFQHLVNITLKTLKLRRNKLSELPVGIFYGLHSLTTLQLDNNTNITEVNNGWLFGLSSLKTLTLSHNKIGAIKEKAWEPTKELTVLDLSSNELGCRQTDLSFKGLQNLKQLLISHNCLANLDPAIFGHLPMLKTLDISHNQIQWNIEDSTGTFQTLVNLEYLDLSYNKIESIHSEVFEPLKSLIRLDLSGNHLKTLGQNPFEHMPHLQSLYFNTSSLVCNCHLSWLSRWLRKETFNSVEAICGFPPVLKGKSVSDLQPADFSCVDLPQPQIISSPKNQTVLFGKSLTLECVARTGDNTAVFIWKKGRVTEGPYKVETSMSVETNSSQMEPMYRVTSHLSIPNVTHETAGDYKCIMRTSLGPSYSVPATIVVHQFPYFTKSPSSVVLKEGSAAELNCAASGFPVPQISWKRQDGEFSAAKERRLHYLPGDSSSFIKPVYPIDSGIYVCTAANEAGSISAEANITVTHAPNFSRPSANQNVALGQSIVLQCEGTGRPRPTVTWYKDDQLLIANENSIFVDNGQFLILLQSTEQDAGTYRCSLGNSLGVQTRNITVSIQKFAFISWPTVQMICLIVVCIVITSFFWLLVIYRNRYMLKRRRRDPDPPMPLYGSKPADGKSRSAQANRTPLLNGHVVDGLPVTNQDSSSEHSSGKDSGVGDSAHRSNEDLRRQEAQFKQPKLPFPESTSTLKSTVPIYGEIEEFKPRLSTFGMPDASQVNNYPTYASLRRGSASRLCPVSTPTMPNHGISSLPRHAYRSQSGSLSLPKGRKHHTNKQNGGTSGWSVTPPRCMEKNTWNDDDVSVPTSDGRHSRYSDQYGQHALPVR